MALSEDQLSKGQRAFLDAYLANGMDREGAEHTAKLAPRSGYAMLNTPKVQRRIVEHQMGRLNGDALPQAVDTLIEIMKNKKAPAAARVSAAKYVIDRTLPVGEEGARKDLHEMSAEDIATELDRLAMAAASKAQDVTPRVIEGEIVDIFD